MDAMGRLPPAALVVVLLAIAAAGCGSAHRHRAVARPAPTSGGETQPVKEPRVQAGQRWPVPLGPVAAGSLPAPVQDAAAAPFGDGAVLIGGVTPPDVSTHHNLVST